MQSTLTFVGGAGAVTGSNFLLDTGGAKFLIDCGLRQGVNEEKNWEPFPYTPAEVSHLFVTHAHLDHIGLIPKLVKDGFRGKIISTKATRSLAEPLLMDAMEILRHNAMHNDRPELYGEDEVQRALSLWEGIGYHEKYPLPDGVVLELFDAGHILGSAMVRLERGGRSLVSTGDLGGGNSPLLPPTDELPPTSYLLMEGTYGDKVRPDDAARFAQLEDVIENAVARGGTLIIPAFSTERTQDLLFDIRKLMVEKRVPDVPVYLDSPLAEKITRAYMAHPEYFSTEVRKRVEAGEEVFNFPQLHYASSAEDSHKLNDIPGTKIILAGSGMSSGGRVFGHERRFLPDPKSTVLIVGYQAVGTLGRQLVEGVPVLKANHEKVPVKAHIEQLYGYSAHADGEKLLEFANKAAAHVEQVFIVHGEPASAMFLAQRIRDYLGVKATVPEAQDKAVLEF